MNNRVASSRRRFVASTAALSTAMVAAPFVRGAHAAGKLSVGLWDHWVPGANAATEKLVKEWAEKEKVDVQLDFITSTGQQAHSHRGSRGAGKVGPRYSGFGAIAGTLPNIPISFFLLTI